MNIRVDVSVEHVLHSTMSLSLNFNFTLLGL